MYNVEEYKNMQSEPLPYVTKWGLFIANTDGHCSNCDKPLISMKRSIIETEEYIVIRSVGACPDCLLLVTLYPVKITRDNQYFSLKDGQWMLMVDPDIPTKIKNWFISLFQGRLQCLTKKNTKN